MHESRERVRGIGGNSQSKVAPKILSKISPVDASLDNNQSYKQVMVGSGGERRIEPKRNNDRFPIPIYLNVQGEESTINWLSKCLVGKVKDVGKVQSLQDVFFPGRASFDKGQIYWGRLGPSVQRRKDGS